MKVENSRLMSTSEEQPEWWNTNCAAAKRENIDF